MRKYKTIIDVRTKEEFNGGHHPTSINIPLQEIVSKEEEIKAMAQPILFCCASGNRSGQATSFMKSKGLECDNGGSWFDLV